MGLVACGGTDAGYVGPSALSPEGNHPPLRPDLLGGSVPSVSLRSELARLYRFPGVAFVSYAWELDTRPSDRQVQVAARLVPADGGDELLLFPPRLVRTPFATTLSAAVDGVVLLEVFDPQHPTRELSLRQLRVRAPADFDPASFRVVVHVAGEGFVDRGAPYGDLSQPAQRDRFAGDLVAELNTIYAQAGIAAQLTEVRSLSNAQVAAVHPELVVGGRTRLEAETFSLWGDLGVPAGDPVSGRAVDVFLVHSTTDATDAVLGVCACLSRPLTAGVFLGAGPRHPVVIRLQDSDGQPAPFARLAETLAHELGHFLSLGHPTERDFAPDDIGDTPIVPPEQDLDGSGLLDQGDELVGAPGSELLMFFGATGLPQRDISPEQGAAMRAYLATREH